MPPEVLCLQAEDVIMLAPDISATTVKGLLIAMETASNTTTKMVSPCGITAYVKVPQISNKYEAIEDAELEIVGVIDKKL